MAKKYDKVPRKKKKEIKKKSGLAGQAVPKEKVVGLANKEAQKKKRDAATTRRYNQNKAYLQSLNIPTDIITKSTTIKETKKRAEEYQNQQAKSDRKRKQEQTYANKLNKLMKGGYSYDEAERLAGSVWKPVTNAEIDRLVAERQKPTISSTARYTGKTTLYVGAAQVRSGLQLYDFSSMTDEQIKAQISHLKSEAEGNPDDSNSLYMVFQVRTGSKADMDHAARQFYKRGYDLSGNVLKVDNHSYGKITCSNSWTQREFLEMALTCATQMKNEDVGPFLSQMKRYCRQNGMPFMDDVD